MGKGGRKPIYDISSLKIGGKMALDDKIAQFKDQYLHYFRKQKPKWNLVIVSIDGKVYVKRQSDKLPASASPQEAQRA